MQTYLITKRNETGNLKPEPGSSPSVRQEVDLDIRVPRSAIVPDRKFFGSKHGDDQLMTNFVVPQLQLQKTIGVKTGTGPAAAEPGRTQNPAEAVTARRTQVRGLWQNRTSAETLQEPIQRKFLWNYRRTAEKNGAATQKSQPTQIISISDWKSGTVTPERTRVSTSTRHQVTDGGGGA